MKIKHKSLILGSTAVIGLCPSASLITSCHKITLDEAVNNIKNSIISEFQWICQYYRKTFCNRHFCNELAKRIRKMGFTVVKDWDEVNDRPINYKPNVDTPYGYNMYFDIPANGVGVSYPMIALQAHTDMVCVVKTDAEGKTIEYDWSKGVIPVVDKDATTGKTIMHSKDWNTTLGADDGAGVATMLAFAKHWKEFNHGKIRCIFTVDEEDGESGAKYLPKEWLNELDYYLSLDGEKSHINWNYSAGAEQAKYVLTETNKPEVCNQQFHVSISGLEGGHSGLAIQEEHLHPNIIVGYVLKYLTQAGYTDVRLVNCWDNADPKEAPNGGSIPTGVTFDVQFNGTTATVDDITTIVNNAVAFAKKQELQRRASDVPTINVKSVDTKLETGLTKETTAELVNFLTQYTKYKLYFYTPEEEVRPGGESFPLVGNNIGGLRVGDQCKALVPDYEKGEKDTLYIEFFGRSTKTELLDQFLENDIKQSTETGILNTAIKENFVSSQHTGVLSRIAYNAPWIKNEQNPLQGENGLIHQASKHYKNELHDEPVFGWLELAEVYEKNPGIHYGIIGPQIEDLHKPKERIELDSLALMNKLVIYIMQHLKW